MSGAPCKPSSKQAARIDSRWRAGITASQLWRFVSFYNCWRCVSIIKVIQALSALPELPLFQHLVAELKAIVVVEEPLQMAVDSLLLYIRFYSSPGTAEQLSTPLISPETHPTVHEFANNDKTHHRRRHTDIMADIANVSVTYPLFWFRQGQPVSSLLFDCHGVFLKWFQTCWSRQRVLRSVCCTSLHGHACACRGRKSCFLLSVHFNGGVGDGCGREGCNSLVGVSFVSLFRRLIASRIAPCVVDCSQEVPKVGRLTSGRFCGGRSMW